MGKRIYGFAVTIFVLIGLWYGVSHGADKVFTLQFSNNLPATHVGSGVFESWGKEVEKKSKGRVKVFIAHGGTLTSPMQSFDSVVKGTIDIAYGLLGYTSGRFPMMEAVEFPYGIRDNTTASAMTKAFYNRFNPKEMAEVKVLMFNSTQSFVIHSKKLVRTLEDLKGMKIRTSGGTTTRILQALSAVPVVLSSGDVYDALQKNVISGVLTEQDALTVFKWGEIKRIR
jgi:TRAP-type C4-dicarboxylate transport system substrate-binding protein